MGGIASKVRGHLVTRSMQRFNIEARTEKLLNQPKPTPAPKYDADVRTRQEVLQSMSLEVKEAVESKSEDLHQRLKQVRGPQGLTRVHCVVDSRSIFFSKYLPLQVYVTSWDPPPELRPKGENPDRPLPGKGVRSSRYSGFILDEEGASKVKLGRLTLASVQELLALNRKDPETYTAERLARQYNLQVSHAESMVEFYRVFTHVQLDVEQLERDAKKSLDPYAAQSDWVIASGEDNSSTVGLPAPPAATPYLDMGEVDQRPKFNLLKSRKPLQSSTLSADKDAKQIQDK